MQLFFVLLAIFGSSYFLWRRRVDPLTIGFGSCLVYFVPGFFGTAQFSYGEGLGIYSQPITPAAYLVMVTVLAALMVTSLISDRIPIVGVYGARFDDKILIVMICVAIVSASLAIRDTGVYFLCLDKQITLDKLDRWYHFFSYSLPFCAAGAVVLRRWWLAALCAALIVADIYAGFRTAAGISLIAIATLAGNRLFAGVRNAATYVLLLTALGGSLFLVKHLIQPIKYATSNYCEHQIALDKEKAPIATPSTPAPKESVAQMWEGTLWNVQHKDFYFSAFIEMAEPFVIQSTLNEVIRKDFHTDGGYLVDQIRAGLPLGESLFGWRSDHVVSFNDQFQRALFPRATSSMANNPWAQSYAAGGMWMVVVFAAGYAGALGALALLYRGVAGILKAGVAVVAVWIGFYFHRNDLFVEAILLKHVVYIFAGAVAVGWIIDRLSGGARKLTASK